MIAHIPIKCPYCKKTQNVSEEEIGDLLSHMKMNKVLQIAQQMADKSGPFYDRWVVAMEARGEQMRCRDCSGGQRDHLGSYCDNVPYPYPTISLGQFACKARFRPRE